MIWLCLYAMLPIFTMAQRFGLESHLLLPMSMVSVFFLARAIDNGGWRYYLTAGLALGLTLYTYALTYIVLPLFVGGMLIYTLFLKKFNWKKMSAMLGILAIFAIPLILVQAVNYFDLPEMQIGPFTITKMISYRIQEIEGSSVLENIKGIIRSSFLYDDLTYNTISRYGTMFYISIPFVCLGIAKSCLDGICSLRTRSFSYSVPMLLFFGCEWIMGLTLSGNSVPNSTRMIGIYMPLLYFLVLGLYWMWDIVRNAKWKKAYGICVSICYLICFVHFTGYYFTDYNEDAFPMKWLFYILGNSSIGI